MAMGFQPVVSLWRHRAAKAAPVRDWTQDELAQFYRVEWALGQAGISVETERGLSDEGDPWFAFCKANDGDVVIHIAREGPVYVLAGVLSGGVQRGRDFASLVEQLLAQHPAKSIDRRNRGNVIMHPATMLALLVSIAILQSGGESKAASEDGDSAHAALLKQQGHGQGAAAPASITSALLSTTAGRVSQATAASPTPLVATLEVAQAMSILMVASLATQEPARASTLIKNGDGDAMKLAVQPISLNERGQLTNGGHQAGKDVEAQSATGQADLKSLSDGQAGVEKLLEIVAKLWTMPTATVATAASAAMSVESAMAFFKGEASEPTAAMITVVAPQPKSLPAVAASTATEKAASSAPTPTASVEPATKEVKETKVVAETKPVETKETVQIVHTPASSETTAQTVLKLTVANVKELTVETSSASDSGKLLAAVSEIVSLAKATQSLDSAKSALGKSLELDLGKQSAAKSDTIKTDDVKIGKAEDSKDSVVNDAPKVPDIVSTTVKTGMVKHDVIDDGAIKTTIDKAVAAFYEDVSKVSVAITGKDIIYYSADAVINKSTEVVVELWQFKDGSSISLVGLSHDGLLPYSL